MSFDNTLPHALPWNYPWLKDEIERRDEYIAQLEAELAHQRPQNHDSGAIDGESVKVPAEDESVAHSEPDSREKLEEAMHNVIRDALLNLQTAIMCCVEQGMCVLDFDEGEFVDYQHDEYVGEYLSRAMRLLDCQAAITANELTSESDVPKPTESGEIDTSKDDMRDFDDSREKLEADVRHYLHGTIFADKTARLVFGWLDRQASITEREFMEIREDLTADNLWMHERISELTSERDKLTAEHERIVQEMVDANTRQCERTNELTAERDELTQQVDTLRNQRNAMARKLRQAENDRDRYRAALGKAIDCADEIRRLS